MTAQARILAGAVAVVVSGCLIFAASAQDRDGAAGASMKPRSHYQGGTPSGTAAGSSDGKWSSHGAERKRTERERIRGIRDSGGMSCHVSNDGGYGSGGYGYCYTYEPGFGTQRQPLPLLW
jgi:hypothetical protein